MKYRYEGHSLCARMAAGIAGATLALTASAATPVETGQNELANLHTDSAARIDSTNIGRLRLAWKINTESPVTHRPLIYNGNVYFADWNGNVRAADAKTGKTLWLQKVEASIKERAWHGFAGTGAIGEGLLFEASSEGNAFALDIVSGEVKWETRFVGDEKYAGNSGALLYYKGLIFVGVCSVEEAVGLQIKDFQPTFRGRVVALNAKTGQQMWTFSLVEPPGNGVAVWSSFAVEPDTGTLFITTGNNYTRRATAFSDSIVAVEANTGKLRWARQLTPHDVWTMSEPNGPDYDFGAGPQLFEGRRAEQRLKLVGAGQKSGIYYALDRRTGQVIWQTPVGYGEIGGGIMADAAIGDETVFVWSNNGFDPSSRSADKAPLTVKALDAGTGGPIWTIAKAQPAGVTSAGFLSADVYFVGSLDGRVYAYRTDDGKKLWASTEDQPPIGSSLTVAGDGLYFGTGVPKMFGGNDRSGSGLIAYRIALTPVGRSQ